MPAHSDTSSQFAGWLITMSRALGYSRDSELARALGVEQSTISRWRRGGRPSVEHLARVSTLTGTQLEPLLVLANYVDAAAVRRAELPEIPEPIDPGERLLKEAPLPEVVRPIFMQYWKSRVDEERQRLVKLLEFFATARDMPEDQSTARLLELTRSEIREDLTKLFGALTELETQTDVREESQEAPDPGES